MNYVLLLYSIPFLFIACSLKYQAKKGTKGERKRREGEGEQINSHPTAFPLLLLLPPFLLRFKFEARARLSSGFSPPLLCSASSSSSRLAPQQ